MFFNFGLFLVDVGVVVSASNDSVEELLSKP
jgi:hypothetical protein